VRRQPHRRLRDPRHRACEGTREPSRNLLVVVTGVPGAGKTTLGRALARSLRAAFVSLDEVMEQLWESSPGDAWQLRLAAETEMLARAGAVPGDVVLDLWIAPGRDDERVASLLRGWDGFVVQVACVVSAEIAVARYVDRGRSGGPHGKTDEPLLQRIRDAVPLMASLGVGPFLEVDTTGRVDVPSLAARVRSDAIPG
jgi:hypothetical protein